MTNEQIIILLHNLKHGAIKELAQHLQIHPLSVSRWRDKETKLSEDNAQAIYEVLLNNSNLLKVFRLARFEPKTLELYEKDYNARHRIPLATKYGGK